MKHRKREIGCLALGGEGMTDKVTVKQRLKRVKGEASGNLGGRAIQTEETASTKALKWHHD